MGYHGLLGTFSDTLIVDVLYGSGRDKPMLYHTRVHMGIAQLEQNKWPLDIFAY